MTKGLGRARRGECDLDQNIVLQHARARHVARLRLAFAPSRDLHQHGKIAGLSRAVAQAFPSILGMLFISRRGGECPHLLGKPGGAPGCLESGKERPVYVAQIGDIGQGIDDLGFQQAADATNR